MPWLHGYKGRMCARVSMLSSSASTKYAHGDLHHPDLSVVILNLTAQLMGNAHCTCDIDRNDNNPSTEDVSLEDERCIGWLGKFPVGYKFPPETNVPADCNCNCGESGCTADSAPCCTNGSCECYCSESGCAKEDLTCCANGSCHFGNMKMLKIL